jgi:hypothetical protein
MEGDQVPSSTAQDPSVILRGWKHRQGRHFGSLLEANVDIREEFCDEDRGHVLTKKSSKDG